MSYSILRTANTKISITTPYDFNWNKCTIFPLTKLKRLPFKFSNHLSSNNFDLIHCDLWGLYGKPTYDGKSYFLTIAVYFSHFTRIYLLANKSYPHIKIQHSYLNLLGLNLVRWSEVWELIMPRNYTWFNFFKSKTPFINILALTDLSKTQLWKENTNTCWM